MARVRLSDLTTRGEHSSYIGEVLDRGGNYAHNLLGQALRHAEKLLGREVANSLIAEHSLDSLHGIRQVPLEVVVGA